jgi:hypothetical protein
MLQFSLSQILRPSPVGGAHAVELIHATAFGLDDSEGARTPRCVSPTPSVGLYVTAGSDVSRDASQAGSMADSVAGSEAASESQAGTPPHWSRMSTPAPSWRASTPADRSSCVGSDAESDSDVEDEDMRPRAGGRATTSPGLRSPAVGSSPLTGTPSPDPDSRADSSALRPASRAATPALSTVSTNSGNEWSDGDEELLSDTETDSSAWSDIEAPSSPETLPVMPAFPVPPVHQTHPAHAENVAHAVHTEHIAHPAQELHTAHAAHAALQALSALPALPALLALPVLLANANTMALEGEAKLDADFFLAPGTESAR